MFPREWNTSYGDLDSDMEELALSFESPLGDRHIVRAIARATDTDLLWAKAAGGSSRLGIGLDGLRGGAPGARDQNNKDFFTQIDVVGQYDFDAVKLRWVAGWERSDGEFSGTTWDRGPGATGVPWIYFNSALARTLRSSELGFVAGQNTPSPTFPERPLGNPFGRTVSDDAQDNLINSFYGVLQANLFDDRFFVMGGVRREESETTDTIFVSGSNALTPPTVIENPADKATVPQIGASLKLLPGLNVFASYSESFRPQRGVGRDINNDFFKKPPQQGEGVDFGLKFEVLDGRLSGTVSYFDITVTDIMGRATPPGGGTAYDIVIDGRQVDGWEFDGVWQQGGNQLIVSYAKVSGEGIGADAGQRIAGLPDQRFAVWNKYNFEEGRLKGLFLGAGWSYTADRVVSQGGPMFTEDGSYAVVDALVGYTARIGGRDVEFRLNVKNVTDEVYLYPGAAQTTAFWGDPRSVYFTARFNF
jgi:iron complex outermembrane receptor protein